MREPNRMEPNGTEQNWTEPPYRQLIMQCCFRTFSCAASFTATWHNSHCIMVSTSECPVARVRRLADKVWLCLSIIRRLLFIHHAANLWVSFVCVCVGGGTVFLWFFYGFRFFWEKKKITYRLFYLYIFFLFVDASNSTFHFDIKLYILSFALYFMLHAWRPIHSYHWYVSAAAAQSMCRWKKISLLWIRTTHSQVRRSTVFWLLVSVNPCFDLVSVKSPVCELNIVDIDIF